MIDVDDRFWSKVDASGDCWEWKASTDKDGYGQYGVGSRTDNSRTKVKAHRYSYEALVGPIPQGLTIDHLCRRRSCVNPDHLEAVTIGDNNRRGATRFRNGNKTHCPNGHPYDMFETGRRCRRCYRNRQREYMRRWRA